MNQKVICISVAFGVGILLIIVAVAVAFGMQGEEADEVPGAPLNPADFQAGRSVDGSKPAQSEDDKLWNAGMFEGDIENVDPSVGKNALRGDWFKWPKNTIPYEIASSFDDRERSIIAKAMNEYQEKTCIRFVPRNTEKGYIFITKAGGCWSSVGRTGGRQQLSLDRGCVYTGTVIHEFMHAIGFFHEQSRTDRDEYVKIVTENILSGREGNFKKYGQDKINHLGAKYDTCSVMHYPSWAFAKTRGLKTIEVVKGGACTIGQRDGFSDTDVRKINTLYNCDPDKYPNVGGGGVVTSGTTVATTTKFTVRPTPKTTTTFKPSGCGNNHKWCEYWAKTDECNKNPGYMLVNCRKACNQCDKNLNCVDHESHCQDWANNGWCELLGFYMNKYCPKACNKC